MILLSSFADPAVFGPETRQEYTKIIEDRQGGLCKRGEGYTMSRLESVALKLDV